MVWMKTSEKNLPALGQIVFAYNPKDYSGECPFSIMKFCETYEGGPSPHATGRGHWLSYSRTYTEPPKYWMTIPSVEDL